MNIEDMIDYYAIAKDSNNIKRVEELAHIYDVSVNNDDKDELEYIDAELRTYSSDPVMVQEGKFMTYADDKTISEYYNNKPITKGK